jgi:hypothetical protein
MKKITLFVGDCDPSIAQAAQQFDSDAILVDCNNYENFLNATNEVTGYTSLADLPKDVSVFYKLLDAADFIRYCPPVTWSDNSTTNFKNMYSSIQGITEFYLCVFAKLKNNVDGLDTYNFNIAPYLELVDERKTKNTQLWIAGCSTTAGSGVKDSERYGEVLGKLLNLPVSFLAKAGTSISWAADQIIRSDITAGDIVVWGLTEENRLTIWSEINNRPVHVNVHQLHLDSTGFSSDAITQLLVHDTNFFTAIQKISEVINFCNKIQAKLLIINIHLSDLLCLHLIHNIKEFFLYLFPSGLPIDLGSDQGHPGPKQHQAYADFCQSALKTLHYI